MRYWQWGLVLVLGIGLWFVKPLVKSLAAEASGAFSISQPMPNNGATGVPVNLLSSTYHPSFGYADQAVAMALSGLPTGCTVNQSTFSQQTVHLTSSADPQTYFLTTPTANLDQLVPWLAIGSPTVGFELLPYTSYTLRLQSGANGIGLTCGSQAYWLNQDFVVSFTTGADTVPPQILGPQIQTTSTTAGLSWQTFQAASGQVAYGTSSANQLANESSIGTLHQVTITNLQPNTTYRYQIRSRDPAGNMGTSDGHFTTVGLSDIQVKDITDMAATVAWTSNQPTDTIVEFGTSQTYGDRQGNAGQITAHSLRMIGLQPNTTYHFRIVATNSSGSSIFKDNLFTTAPASAVVGSTDGQTGAISVSNDNIKLFPQVVFQPLVLGASTAARVAGDTISVGRNLLAGGSTAQGGNWWLGWWLWLFPLVLLLLIGGLWWHNKRSFPPQPTE